VHPETRKPQRCPPWFFFWGILRSREGVHVSKRNAKSRVVQYRPRAVHEVLAPVETAVRLVNKPVEDLLRALDLVPSISENGDEVKPPTVVQQAHDAEKLQFGEPRQTASSSAKKTPRRRKKGEAEAILVSALCEWHGFDGGCNRTEPIEVSELARRCNMARSTVSSFFARCFKGHDQYQRRCSKPGELAFSLKLLRGEVLPRHFTQHCSEPSDDQDNDD